MNTNNLNDNELVNKYKEARKCYINAKEFSLEEKQAEEKYDNLWQELQKRNIDLRNYI